jgi:hypothetical protein
MNKLKSIGIAICSILVMTWLFQGCQLYLTAVNSEVSKFWVAEVVVALLLGGFGLIKALEKWDE